MKRIYLSLILLLSAIFLISAQTNNIETVIQSGHSRPVSVLAISPDGTLVATGSYDCSIKIWNTKTGKEIRDFTENTGKINSLQFHQDGKKLLSTSTDNLIVEYDIISGKALNKIKAEEDYLNRACYSPDGKKILSMSHGNIISLWSTETGKLINTFKKGYNGIISPQWFTPDGSMLMTSANYKEAKLTDVNSGNVIKTIPFDKACSFAVSPDGRKIAIGSNKLFAKVFDLETGKELFEHIIDGQTCDGCKTLVSYSHNGKYLLTGSRKTGLVLWDANTGKRIRYFKLEDDHLGEMMFSATDKYIISVYEKTSQVWEVATGKQVMLIQNEDVPCVPVFSSDDKNILTSNINNTAILKRISDGRTIETYKGFRNKASDDGMIFKQGNNILTNVVRSINLKPAMDLSPDGRYLAKGKIDSSVVILDLKTGKKQRILQGHRKVVLAVCFSHNGKLLATAGGDSKIIIWDVETGKMKNEFRVHSDLVFDLQFSADDKYILSGSWDTFLCVSDIETGELVKCIRFDEAAPYRVAYTPNDLYYLTSDLGKNVKLWEADTRKEFRQIIGHSDLVTDLKFSQDGKQIITASLDGTVKIWDLLTGMLLNKFTGHTSGVLSLAIDPNNKFYASGSNDHTIRIWDKETCKEIKVLTGHSGAVSGLYFTPDGSKLISCSTNGEIKVWNLNSFEEIYTYIQLDRDEWLIKTPAGYFDGSQKALSTINYVSGLEVIPVGSLFEKYYTPNLWRRIINGETIGETNGSLDQHFSITPDVRLLVMSSEEGNENMELLSDTIEWSTNMLPLSIQLTDNGGGIDEYRVYNNGKLVFDESMSKSKIRAGKQLSKSVDVAVNPGDNKITVVALNKDRIESEPVGICVFNDGVKSQSNLYILTVGIDKYSNPNYQLSYAVNDASAYAARIKKGAKAIFKNVEHIQLENTEANKEGIKHAFEQIEEKAKPEDVFVFYFAGHGAMSSGTDNSFFIIPYDINQLYGNDEMLKDKGVSADELLDFSKQITAGKQMFILDACQSGGALEAINTRGANREKAIAQLARSTGTFFLLASGAVQFASEAKELGHGIFTYALIEGIDGKADGGELDKKITANELKGYVEDRVPEITSEYMLTPQYPTGYSFGQDFPIVLVK